MTLQLERTTGVKRHLVSLEEYERMCEAGVFEPETRVELLRGEIVDMPPPGPEHENAVASLHLFISELLHRRAMLWPQGNSIRLPNSNSRPQPDITLLRWRDDLYRGKRPVPEDVILLVEVSHKTVKFDKGDKLKLYAEAGIQEYWVVNIPNDVVEVYTDPGDGTYRSVRTGTRGETLQLPGELEGSIAVDDVLGKTEEF